MSLNYKDPNYLMNSGKIEKDLIIADDHNNFFKAILDNNVPESYKEVILKFFIPNKISPLKAKYNQEAILKRNSEEDPDLEIVAPSLVMFLNDFNSFKSYLPGWFYFGFPDVAWWLIKEEGVFYEEIRHSNLLNEGYYDHNALKEFIDVYKNFINPNLECTTFNNWNELHQIGKKECLTEYYEGIFAVLNKNGFKEHSKWDGKIKDFSLGNTDLDKAIFTITDHPEAHSFLLNNGHIWNHICQFCGEPLISVKYKFTEPFNKISFNICESCYIKGRKSQGKSIETNENTKKSGCLIFLTILIFTIASYVLVI